MVKTKKFIWTGALVLCVAMPCLGLAAQNGPLRSLLRERIADRMAQGVNSVPAAPLPAGQAIPGPGRYEIHLHLDGRDRMALIHVPHSYNPRHPAALVVALHGGGGGAIFQADDTKYGLISKSEQAGFIAVFPNGVSDAKNGMLATWNAGKCCGKARDEHVDDVGFLRALVADIAGRANIAPRRVYAIGMSNGAMMAYRLACEAGDVFHAIMAVSGTDNTSACAPRQPVPILHIHAQDDPLVLFNGGAGDKQRFGDAITDFRSVPDTIARWVKLDLASPVPRRVLSVPGAYCDRHDATDGGAPVELCVTETGGHSWPGGHKTRADEAPSQAIRADDLMWDFFNTLPGAR